MTAADPQKGIQIDKKPTEWITPDKWPAKLWISYQRGQKVSYYSNRKRAWISTVITQTHPKRGIKLDRRPERSVWVPEGEWQHKLRVTQGLDGKVGQGRSPFALVRSLKHRLPIFGSAKGDKEWRRTIDLVTFCTSQRTAFRFIARFWT